MPNSARRAHRFARALEVRGSYSAYAVTDTRTCLRQIRVRPAQAMVAQRHLLVLRALPLLRPYSTRRVLVRQLLIRSATGARGD